MRSNKLDQVFRAEISGYVRARTADLVFLASSRCIAAVAS